MIDEMRIEGRSTPFPRRATWRRLSADRIRVAAGAGLVTLLSALYLVALVSPLRLSWDAVVYLSLSRELVTGDPYETNLPYPNGYPQLLALLDRGGMAIAWVFVAVNLIFLAIGLISTYHLLRKPLGLSRATALVACSAILLVHDVIGVASIPLSDAPFFGVSMLCLLILERSAQLKGSAASVAIAAAAALAGAAFEIRTLGIALWPAVLFSAITQPAAARLRNGARRHPVAATLASVIILTLLGAAAVSGIVRTGYPRLVGDRPPGFLAPMKSELSALGQLATNVVASSPHVPDALRPLLSIAGVLLISIVAVGVARRRRLGVLEVYGLSATLVLVAWPLDAPRLWIPVLPLLIGYAIIGARTLARPQLVRIGLALYVLGFAGAGALVLGNSVRLSISRSEFPDRWARETPLLHATYQVAFGRATPATVGPPDPGALRVLRYYEPRAAKPRR